MSTPGDLFAEKPHSSPLADRLRPRTLEEVIGQSHLIGADKPLRRALLQGEIPSLILWGPPGCGKTTLARLLAEGGKGSFEAVPATLSGVAELRAVFEHAKRRCAYGEKTFLFVDEIHRFNRGQQDILLPYMEDGTVTLIGATTENPSFSLNAALLSRAQVLCLKSLTEEDLLNIIARANQFLPSPLPLDIVGQKALAHFAQGDARTLLNYCELLSSYPETPLLKEEELTSLLNKRPALYDQKGEQHYNLISALHKSLRGSDVDGALYWLMRMLNGGEDPLYIARRLIRFASEDIGLADPHALLQALSACEAYERLGSPEGELAIVQAVAYLATAPKSNALYLASKSAKKTAAGTSNLPPPKIILNAPTPMMKNLGYGEGYEYDHDTPEGFSGQNYFPEEMHRHSFYKPVERGFEREIIKRLQYWQALRDKKSSSI